MNNETLSIPANVNEAVQTYLNYLEKAGQANGRTLSESDKSLLSMGVKVGWLLCTKNNNNTISLPREMDEDLYYIVGGAMGAESPEQCGRADSLWKKLVSRADYDNKN